MNLTREDIIRKLNEEIFAALITIRKTKLASRTMMFGYLKGVGIFFLTLKITKKIKDIEYSPVGIIHLSKIEDNLPLSWNISIPGKIEECKPDSPHYKSGFDALAKKNPQIKDLFNSDMKDNYSLLLFRIKEIQGWTYEQCISGVNNTVVKDF